MKRSYTAVLTKICNLIYFKQINNAKKPAKLIFSLEKWMKIWMNGKNDIEITYEAHYFIEQIFSEQH